MGTRLDTIRAVKGTYDLLPSQDASVPVENRMGWWARMERTAREVLSAACYAEIRTPIFERTELFERGVGEATDVVSKEMYTFETREREGRGGDRVTLRPENTAGVVRAFLQHGLRTKEPMPLKLFYVGPQFRYEKPQKGRQRQFHQLGVEVLDTDDPRADAEVILVACEYLRALGLDDLVVDLNSLGDPDDRARYRSALVAYLNGVRDELDPDSVERIDRNPLRVLDSKIERTQKALEGAPSILDALGPAAQEHFDAVRAHLEALDIEYRIVPTLVRGLDYYSRTTFEIQSQKLGAQSTVCGGGRYDGLVEELGGPAVPAVGWALGLERLAIVLEETRGAAPAEKPVAFLIGLDDEARRALLPLARDLRREGVRCEISFSSGNVGRQFKAADRRGAAFAVVVGEQELKNGTASVKNLGTGDQVEVARAELARNLQPERSKG